VLGGGCGGGGWGGGVCVGGGVGSGNVCKFPNPTFMTEAESQCNEGHVRTRMNLREKESGGGSNSGDEGIQLYQPRKEVVYPSGMLIGQDGKRSISDTLDIITNPKGRWRKR